MGILTGPSGAMYALTTIPGTAAVAMTAFKAKGNSLELSVTTDTGGVGSLTFTAEASQDGGTTYGDVIDRDSVWSMSVTEPDTAGTYVFPLEGLSLTQGDWYRISYTAATASGKLAVNYVCWDNPARSLDISVGDVVVDMDDVSTNTAATAASLASVIGTDGTTGPAATVSIGGTDAATGKIEEISVDANGRVDVAPIDGQTGIAANAGAMDALTTRVTVATDDTHFGAVGAAADVDGVVHGQLHSIGLAVEIMDDWDESDRAKVNPIAGQAGIAANTGVMDALTTRVTLATDDTMTAAANALLGTIDADTSNLASAYTGATTSLRFENIDPLSAQYGTTSVISDEAVATALDTATEWQAVGGYGPLSLQIYLLGGIKTGPSNCTVTMTIEATNGATVAAATDAVDITESFKSLLTGADSAASYTSTGATAYRDILTLRREDANFTHYRVAYAWDDTPTDTAGAIVAMARNAAI